jgi:hypothetical protein
LKEVVKLAQRTKPAGTFMPVPEDSEGIHKTDSRWHREGNCPKDDANPAAEDDETNPTEQCNLAADTEKQLRSHDVTLWKVDELLATEDLKACPKTAMVAMAINV